MHPPTWGWSKSSSILFLIVGTTATKCFLPDQKILFLTHFKNTGNYSTHADVNHDFPSQSYGLSKLGSHLLLQYERNFQLILLKNELQINEAFRFPIEMAWNFAGLRTFYGFLKYWDLWNWLKIEVAKFQKAQNSILRVGTLDPPAPLSQAWNLTDL